MLLREIENKPLLQCTPLSPLVFCFPEKALADEKAEMDPQVHVYKSQKGVRRVAGLQKKLLNEGKNIAVVPAAVSLLLSDKHLEFTVVFDTAALEGSPDSQSGPRWIGFSYFGYAENLKRCFRKPLPDLSSYLKVLHVIPAPQVASRVCALCADFVPCCVCCVT